MSNRLELIATLVEDGVGVADVGTDHAYLPIMLRRSGYTGNIIAGDINEGPLEKARKSLEYAGLSDSVELVLSDGLNGVDSSKVDTVIVAGMGGDTITSILDRGLYDMPEWASRSDYKLILQPVTKPEILRFWLVNNGFSITSEWQTEENGVLYQIICAQPGESPKYKDAELFTGRLDQIQDSKYLDKLLSTHIKRFESAVNSLKNAEKASLRAWNMMMISMIAELEDMKGRKND